jgi:hypothetical protein
VELYDLAHDPLEIKNLSGTPASAEVQRKLQARLDRWWRGSPAHPS